MRQWRIIGRHNRWVSGAKITETLLIENSRYRRFTATIEGWGNWKIWQGDFFREGLDAETLVRLVKTKVTQIRDRIRAGDESVFQEPGAW